MLGQATGAGRCHWGSQAGVRNEDGLERNTQDEGKHWEAEALA